MRTELRAALILALTSCGARVTSTPDPSTNMCTPGQQIECACPGAANGVQVCKDDGNGYDRCDCIIVGTGGAAGSVPSDASVGAGSGGASGSSGSAGAPGIDAEADRIEASPPGPCASGQRWIDGSSPSAEMNPGVPCMGSGCHTSSSKTVLTMGGTVYPFSAPHDENNCFGLDSTISLAAIAILDADTGQELMRRLLANPSGNFFTTTPLPPTYKVKVISAGREAIMNAPVSDGNCNACHTAEDFMNAKGRITPQPP